MSFTDNVPASVYEKVTFPSASDNLVVEATVLRPATENETTAFGIALPKRSSTVAFKVIVPFAAPAIGPAGVAVTVFVPVVTAVAPLTVTTAAVAEIPVTVADAVGEQLFVIRIISYKLW